MYCACILVEPKLYYEQLCNKNCEAGSVKSENLDRLQLVYVQQDYNPVRSEEGRSREKAGELKQFYSKSNL